MQTRTGIDAPHFSKWKGGAIPGPGLAAQFARGYKRPVLEAFVAAGFLTEAEAKVRPVAAPSPDSLTDQELVEEILRRMSRGGGGDDRNAAPMNVEQSAPAVLRAARRGASRGKRMRDELDAAGEEPQGEASDGGA